MPLKDLLWFPFMPGWQHGGGGRQERYKSKTVGIKIGFKPFCAMVRARLQDSCLHPALPSQQHFPKPAAGTVSWRHLDTRVFCG